MEFAVHLLPQLRKAAENAKEAAAPIGTFEITYMYVHVRT